jgi:UDP-2-acetamido-3-amino-2,3-dideoxy-glucuronate N-acetyltransferase
MGVKIHTSAEVSEKAKIGENTAIWNHSQIREDSVIGENCNIGKNVYVDFDVKIGNNVKIQNNVSVYRGVIIEDDVFLGPSMVFTNDLYPRSFRWESGQIMKTLVKKGASIGANATIICGDRVIGRYAMVAAGSVVTKNIPDYGLVVGNPARLVGFVCKCGRKAEKVVVDEREVGIDEKNVVMMKCNHCNETFEIPKQDYVLLVK